jgi:hypothetical protein
MKCCYYGPYTTKRFTMVIDTAPILHPCLMFENKAEAYWSGISLSLSSKHSLRYNSWVEVAESYQHIRLQQCSINY